MSDSDLETSIKEALIELRVSGDSLSGNLDRILTRAGGANNDTTTLLKNELNLVYQNITEYEPPADVLRLIPVEAARTYCVIPLDLAGNTLKIAVIDPTDMDLLMDLHMLSGRKIYPVTSDRKTIENMIVRYYHGPGNTAGPGASTFSITSLKGPVRGKGTDSAGTGFARAAETPVIRLVNDIISDAVNSGASDIHFEPFEREMKVRFRQDGILRVYRTINSRSMPEVVSRIKVMASMDIAERRRPQDGRIRIEGGDKTVDMRISTLPTEHGEKVVVRILDRGAVALDLASIGMDRKGLEMLEKAIRLPYGMILVTGPTGSGKTTTLYSALNRIKSPELNISTIEDPIEYKLEGIVQTAVKKEINLTFANALRTMLRQDPNVIMVGEIRDEETAQMAIRAALTGHLVFSTLHTNDAPGAVTRLLDMGIEPFLVSSSVTLIMAQRLVRKVCPECSDVSQTQPEVLSGLGLKEPDYQFRRGKGCMRCGQTGYSGRIGLFEIMPVTDGIRTLIKNREDASRIRDHAISEGMLTLRRDGMNKAKAGITTPEEVLRETT
jgi:type IV pilus assembly protein PilB